MKKVFITLCVIMMTAVTAFAGGGKKDRDTRYLLSKPSQNWFIDASVTGSFFQSSDFVPRNFGPFHGPFIGVSGRFGKMVTPMLGFSVAYDYHPFQNHNSATAPSGPNWAYKNAHFDMLFSPIDLLTGFNMDRFFRLYLYAGMGVMGFNEDATKFILSLSDALELGINGGLMNCFRISRSLDFHIDLQGTVVRWSFDEFETPYQYRAHTDWEAMAGLIWYMGGRTFEIGKAATDVTDCTEQENRINELMIQINDLQDQLSNAGQNIVSGETIIEHDTIVKIVNGEVEVITYPLSIFFNKGSYELRDGRDRINLQEIAQAAIDHNLKVNLRGTCDSGTASAAFNRTLAENRCNKVKSELEKIGVPAENIIIEAIGGVSELKPAEYDRRVLIQFSK